MKNKISETGRSMVEMIAVLGILGVIAVGGISTMSYIDASFRASTTLLEVDKLANDLMDLCTWADSYTECINKSPGNFNTLLCQEGILTCQDGAALNYWGGNITVEAHGDGGNNFKISYQNVPFDVCDLMVEEFENESTRHMVQMENECGGGSVDFVFYERELFDNR